VSNERRIVYGNCVGRWIEVFSRADAPGKEAYLVRIVNESRSVTRQFTARTRRLQINATAAGDNLSGLDPGKINWIDRLIGGKPEAAQRIGTVRPHVSPSSNLGNVVMSEKLPYVVNPRPSCRAQARGDPNTLGTRQYML
jgi:hypothetical protein